MREGERKIIEREERGEDRRASKTRGRERGERERGKGVGREERLKNLLDISGSFQITPVFSTAKATKKYFFFPGRLLRQMI